MERVHLLFCCLNLAPSSACQVGRAVPGQGPRSNVGDRNRESQPLAWVPYFLVEAQRASQGLSEEGAAIKGGAPPSFPNIR